MAQDPYGFKETMGGGGATGGEGAGAMWAGFASLMCCALGPCFCQIPFLLALPIGLYSVYAGYVTMTDAAPSDGNARTMGLAGLIGGLTASMVSGGFLLFWLCYVGFLFFAVFAGALLPQN